MPDVENIGSNGVSLPVADAQARADIAELNASLVNLIDTIYPVGCYFETTDTTFDPNTAFGGTWVLEDEGLVHISSGTNYAVSNLSQDGGEKTHLLTSSESGVPAHSHVVQAIYNSTYKNLAGAWQNTTNNTSTSGVAWDGQAGSWSIRAVNNTNQNASASHNNMQPYKIVNRWHRTA